jgi:hypothetical protein
MPRWTKIATPIAIASPITTIFIVCVVFVSWFGYSTAHTVEVAAVQHQAERVATIISYLQHLVDDSVVNAELMQAELAHFDHAPFFAELEGIQRQARADRWLRSSTHIRYIALLDEHGKMLSNTAGLLEAPAPLLEAALGMQRDTPNAFRPLQAPLADPSQVPDFLFVRKLSGGPVGYVAFLMSPQALGRASNFKVSHLDVNLAMIDTDSLAVAAFGGGVGDSKDVVRRVYLASREPTDAGLISRCYGYIVLSRVCLVYERLNNSSLTIYGARANSGVDGGMGSAKPSGVGVCCAAPFGRPQQFRMYLRLGAPTSARS